MKKNKKTTFTKKIITAILAIALLDMQLPFVLAFTGHEQVVESLGQAIATEIVGVFLVYCCKSYFETKAEKNNELERERIGMGDE